MQRALNPSTTMRRGSWVNQSIKLNMIPQALSPRREVLTLEMKMVRNAEQNLFGGGLGVFFANKWNLSKS